MNAATRRYDPNRIALVLGIATMLLGTTVLAGWAFDIAAIKSVAPGLVNMKANTAAGMVLCGGALALLAGMPSTTAIRIAASALAIVVIAAAGVTLSQDLLQWDAGIDRWLFAGAPASGGAVSAHPWRMSPTTALCFLLVGTALIAALWRAAAQSGGPAPYALAASVLVIGGLGLLGHGAAVLAGTRWWNFAGMAMPTTLGFLLLGTGLLAWLQSRAPLAWSLSRANTLGFALGLATLVGATGITYSLINQSRTEAAWVTHTQEVLKEIGEASHNFSRLESGQRGFIITGDAGLLTDRPARFEALLAHLASLRRLTDDNPAQQRRLEGLGPLVRERYEFANRTIALRGGEGFAASQALVSTGTGIRLSENIHRLLQEMTDEEYRLLEARRGRAEDAAATTFLLLPLGVFLSLTMMLIALFLLNAGTGRRHYAESALQKTQAKYRQFVEQASAGIFVIDQSGCFLYANPRAHELLGYAEGELTGVDHSVTYLEEDRRVIPRRFARVKAGELLRYERTVLRKDGSSFPAEFSSRMLDSGEFQIIFHDISERRRAEARQRESEEKYRSLIEQASDGIFISDAQGEFLMVNTRGCELLGYRAEELIGVSGRITYVEGEEELHARRMREVAAGATLSFERMVRRKDGTAFPAEISIKRLDNGLVQVIFRDITERHRAQKALVEERTLLRTLVDALPDIVFTKDREGRFTMANAAAFRHGGKADEAALIGGTVEDFYPPELAARYRADDEAALRGESVVNREEPGMDAAGRQRWYLTIKAPLRDAAGGISGMIAISRDITERREQEERIARLARIQAVLSGINSAIVRIRDRDELFREACRIATEAGAFRIALIGMQDANGRLAAVGWGGAGGELLTALPEGAQGAPTGVAARAIREGGPAVENDILLRPDIDAIRIEAIRLGCRSAIALPLFHEQKACGMIMLYSTEKHAFDAEEIKLLEELAGDVSFALTFIAQQEKVDYLAYFDPLTGLPNRSLFFDRLGRQLAGVGRRDESVALVVFDLDRFRAVNDTLGRQAGDALLKAVADRIRAVMRESDSVARMGADGFAIAATGAWHAQELAHLIESRNGEMFGQPFHVAGEELRISATAGVALCPADATTAETLVANAEAAMRSAQQENVPLLFYGREMNAQAAESLRMENRLRKAMEKQELALWYQPKIDTRSGKFTGFEALMRWIDPESGPVSPARFIPIMEKTGLIMEAGTWALQQVARDCETWMKGSRAAPRIAVNVSPLQLRDKNFVDSVIDAADKIDAAGGILDLEITESVIMDNVDAVIPKLQTVRGLGVRIYVDDFGTGYSSLAYIARLPIYALKIDRSFVVGMTQSEDSLSIVQSVISLAHSLKLRVVAEGVETEAQAELLKRLGCDELQGYLFGKPTPPPELQGVLGKFG